MKLVTCATAEKSKRLGSNFVFKEHSTGNPALETARLTLTE